MLEAKYCKKNNFAKNKPKGGKVTVAKEIKIISDNVLFFA